MTYEYEILKPGSTEDVAARFTTSDPLPHIQPGHRLIVSTAGQVAGAGPHPVIEAVDIHLSVSDAGLERTRVSVLLRGVGGIV